MVFWIYWGARTEVRLIYGLLCGSDWIRACYAGIRVWGTDSFPKT